MPNPIHLMPGLVAGGRRLTLGNELTPGEHQFGYTGAVQEFVIPAGMDSIYAAIWGASGGTATPGGFRAPGRGGWAEIMIDVEEGDILEIEVGQGGGPGVDNVQGGFGGWPDGGDGARGSNSEGSGGGGSTRIRLNGVDLAIGGAGGGENGSSGTGGSGGHGGGTNGEIHSGFSPTMTAASQTVDGLSTTDVGARPAGRSANGRLGGHAYGSDAPNRSTSTGDSAGAGGGGGGFRGGAGGDQSGGGSGAGFVLPVADSNSPTDRHITLSRLLGPSSDPMRINGNGWRDGAGFRPTVAATAGYDGYVYLFAASTEEASEITLGPQDWTDSGNRTSSNYSNNAWRLRKVVAKCDMFIESIEVFTDATFDSNSPGGTAAWFVGVFSNNAANQPCHAMGRSAEQIGEIEGGNDIPLQFPVFVEKGKAVWIGAICGANQTTLTTCTTANPDNTESKNITSIPYGLGALTYCGDVTPTATTTNYMFRAHGYAALDEPNDFAMAVVPFTLAASTTGSLDITDSALGGRVPKAVYIFGGNAPPNSTDNHLVFAQGISAHGGNIGQFCTSFSCEDGQTSSDAESEQREGSIISVAAPGDTVASTPRSIAALTEWITNGVRINVTTADSFNSRQYVAVMFAGETVEAVAALKVDWGGANTYVIDRLGFEPTFMLNVGEFSNAGNGNGSNSLGAGGLGFMAWADGSQGCWFHAQDTGISEGGRPNNYISDTNLFAYAGTSITVEDQFAATPSTEGFSVTTNVTLTACDHYWLAVKLRGCTAKVIPFTSPTATGVQNVTGAGFDPTLAILIGTTNESYASAYNTIDASGFGIAAFDVNGGVGLGFNNDHDADPTDTASAAADNKFIIGRDNNPQALSADWDGFITDGFALDWTAVPATGVKCLALVIGPE